MCKAATAMQASPEPVPGFVRGPFFVHTYLHIYSHLIFPSSWDTFQILSETGLRFPVLTTDLHNQKVNSPFFPEEGSKFHTNWLDPELQGEGFCLNQLPMRLDASDYSLIIVNLTHTYKFLVMFTFYTRFCLSPFVLIYTLIFPLSRFSLPEPSLSLCPAPDLLPALKPVGEDSVFSGLWFLPKAIQKSCSAVYVNGLPQSNS